MLWFTKNALSWVELLCMKIVKTGRIPKHIAFIMDGNRRFADKYNIKKREGHSKGFDKLTEVIQWWQKLEIPEITVYAFSIENFKRNEEEVDTLMSLAIEKFQIFLDERDFFMKNGIRVRIIGKLTLLPVKLRSLMAKIMVITKNNNKARLNIAFAYTGRDEITTAIGDIVQGVKKGLIRADDISEELMDKTMELTAPDLLVRTSGEIRLSDFMVWQVSNACLYFTPELWPEYTIWHLLKALVHFQRVYSDNISDVENNKRQKNFLNDIERNKWKCVENYALACLKQ